MIKTIYIYVLIDPRNNEIRYVGKSINPNVRVRRHISEAKNSKQTNHRINWLKNLASDGYKPIIEIIDEVVGEWEWLEIYWINQLKVWGFKLVNSTDGGENPPLWSGKTHSKEHKEKLSERMKFNNPSKKITNQWKKNISNTHKKNNYIPSSAIAANKIKVKQYSLTGEYIKTWDSISEAAIKNGIKSPSTILHVCRKNRFKAGNFRWTYENDLLEEYISKRKTKEIVQMDSCNNEIKIWLSISLASKELGLDISSISKACKDTNKNVGGFKWRYKNG